MAMDTWFFWKRETLLQALLYVGCILFVFIREQSTETNTATFVTTANTRQGSCRPIPISDVDVTVRMEIREANGNLDVLHVARYIPFFTEGSVLNASTGNMKAGRPTQAQTLFFGVQANPDFVKTITGPVIHYVEERLTVLKRDWERNFTGTRTGPVEECLDAKGASRSINPGSLWHFEPNTPGGSPRDARTVRLAGDGYANMELAYEGGTRTYTVYINGKACISHANELLGLDPYLFDQMAAINEALRSHTPIMQKQIEDSLQYVCTVTSKPSLLNSVAAGVGFASGVWSAFCIILSVFARNCDFPHPDIDETFLKQLRAELRLPAEPTKASDTPSSTPAEDPFASDMSMGASKSAVPLTTVNRSNGVPPPPPRPALGAGSANLRSRARSPAGDPIMVNGSV